MGRIDGKVAIITGAASGMGRASAHLFAAEGARLLLADINGEACEAVAAEVRSSGANAIAVRVDVSDPPAVESMVQAAVDAYGTLDILFNNAGIEGPSARLTEVSCEDWDRVIAVNLKGVFLGMKYGLPAMVAGGGGSIINTASAVGLVGWPGAAAYSASKGGVVIITKTAAIEYASRNVRVNAICPGIVHTPMVDRITGGSDEAIERMRRAQPIARVGQPQDIAQMALFLASDESTFITGAAIPVDGGLTAR
ncbi:MAG: SDR family NAD(P)-dependent oxidoreductase [Tepidiformaceae bacterium]